MLLSDYQREFLFKILSFKSTGGKPSEGAPYGTASREVLEAFIEEAKASGFSTGIIDDKVGWIEFGSGEKLIGIVCHLDVVPAGEGWDSDAFTPIEKDGVIFARGIVDDKGPACAAFFAMKELLDSGTYISSRVRLILGTDEERTCDCVETYSAKGEIPDIAITPDAEFPVIYAEKGILQVKISDPLFRSATGYGGDAANMVPAAAHLTYKDKEIITSGKPAHASKPELGINAIDRLPDAVRAAGIDTDALPLLRFIERFQGDEGHAELTGCSITDDSGSLTANTGVLRMDENDSYIVIDIRYPVTADLQIILDHISRAAAAYGLSSSVSNHMPPLYKDRNSTSVRTLTDIWKEHMSRFDGYKDEYADLYSEPMAIGGGTYARHMPNTIAFGVQAPWAEDQCHQANEHMSVNDLTECISVIKEAVLRLSEA